VVTRNRAIYFRFVGQGREIYPLKASNTHKGGDAEAVQQLLGFNVEREGEGGGIFRQRELFYLLRKEEKEEKGGRA